MPVINQAIVINKSITDDLTGLGGLDVYSSINANPDDIIQLDLTVRFLSYIEMQNWTVKLGLQNSIHSINAFESGINIGDSFRVIYRSQQNLDLRGVVTGIDPDTIYFDEVVPWTNSINNKTFPEDYLYITTQLNDVEYSYGLFQDTEQFNSYLDGAEQKYRFVGLDGTPTIINGEPLGNNWNSGTATAQFVGTGQSPLPESGSFSDLAQDFKIVHTFSYQTYNDDQRDDITDNQIPFVYKGKAFDYAYKLTCYKDINEPDTSKTQEGSLLVNGGWYNTVFNAPTNKQISGLEIRRDNGDLVQGLIPTENNNVQFIVSNCDANTIIVLRHKKLAQSDDYETDNNYNDIFYTSTVRVIDNSGVSSGFFSNAVITLIGTDLDVRFGIDFQDPTLNTEEYLLSVSVQENKFNRTTLIVDQQEYFNDFDREGLLINSYPRLFQRDCTDFTPLGASDFNNIIKAEVFYVKQDILVVDGLIDSIEVQTLGQKNTEFQVFGSRNIDLTNLVIVDGEQRIDDVVLNQGNNSILNGYIRYISTGVYQMVVPYRLEFDKNTKSSTLSDPAPADIYDPNEPFAGSNEDIIRLQSLGYDITIAVRIGMLYEGVVTYYRFRTPNMPVLDFETSIV